MGIIWSIKKEKSYYPPLNNSNEVAYTVYHITRLRESFHKPSVSASGWGYLALLPAPLSRNDQEVSLDPLSAIRAALPPAPTKDTRRASHEQSNWALMRRM